MQKGRRAFGISQAQRKKPFTTVGSFTAIHLFAAAHVSAVVEFCLSFEPKKPNKTESERERESVREKETKLIIKGSCCGAKRGPEETDMKQGF